MAKLKDIPGKTYLVYNYAKSGEFKDCSSELSNASDAADATKEFLEDEETPNGSYSVVYRSEERIDKVATYKSKQIK